jgi:hypothetical protein
VTAETPDIDILAEEKVEEESPVEDTPVVEE